MGKSIEEVMSIDPVAAMNALDQVIDNLNVQLQDKQARLNGYRGTDATYIRHGSIFLMYRECGRDCFACPHPEWRQQRLRHSRKQGIVLDNPRTIQRPSKTTNALKFPKVMTLVKALEELLELRDRMVKQHRSHFARDYQFHAAASDVVDAVSKLVGRDMRSGLTKRYQTTVRVTENPSSKRKASGLARRTHAEP